MIIVLKINCGLLPTRSRIFSWWHNEYMSCDNVCGRCAFPPPGVAYMTGLSHNPFTQRLLYERKGLISPKSCSLIMCKTVVPSIDENDR